MNLKQTTKKRSKRRRRRKRSNEGNSPKTKSERSCKLGPLRYCAGSSGGAIIARGRVDVGMGDFVIGREGLTEGKIALRDLIEISLILRI